MDESPGVKLERLDNGLMDFETGIEWLNFAFLSRPLPRIGKTIGDKTRKLLGPAYGENLFVFVNRIFPLSDGLR